MWPEISSAAITGTTFEKEAHRVFDEACEIIQEGSDLDEERLFGLRVRGKSHFLPRKGEHAFSAISFQLTQSTYTLYMTGRN